MWPHCFRPCRVMGGRGDSREQWACSWSPLLPAALLPASRSPLQDLVLQGVEEPCREPPHHFSTPHCPGNVPPAYARALRDTALCHCLHCSPTHRKCITRTAGGGGVGIRSSEEVFCAALLFPATPACRGRKAGQQEQWVQQGVELYSKEINSKTPIYTKSAPEKDLNNK